MNRLLRLDYLTKASISKVITEIDAYNRNWKVQEYLNVDHLRELRQLATVQSIGSSTRIEGGKLSDEAISELIAHLEIQKLSSRDEQEVAAYFTTLEIIQEQYRDLELTESLIRALHNELMRYSSKDEHDKGKYKKQSNQVVATDQDGEQRVIFQTTEPALTPMAMEAAVKWYNEEHRLGNHHPLVLIAAFVYEFLSIHPFKDGNGRLSRLLTNLLLLQNGYEFVLYSSLERVIENNKVGYYKALMSVQRYRGNEEEQIGRWLYFLLHSIRQITERLSDDEKSMVEEPSALYINTRQRRVLDFIRKEGALSVRELDELLPETSRNTVKYDLKRLTEAGLLVQKGKGRATVYDEVA